MLEIYPANHEFEIDIREGVKKMTFLGKPSIKKKRNFVNEIHKRGGRVWRNS